MYLQLPASNPHLSFSNQIKKDTDMEKLLVFFFLVFPVTLLHAADLLISDKPYTENGQIQMEKKKDSDEQTRVERGKINAISYVINYADSQAAFGNAAIPGENWAVLCKKYSAISDVHCAIRQKGLSVYIYASGDNGVSIGPNLYPKSATTILIDEDKPLSTKKRKKGVFDKETGLAVVKKLNSSSKVCIRYAQWPNKKPFEQVIDMQGYDEVVAYARWAMTHLQESTSSY